MGLLSSGCWTERHQAMQPLMPLDGSMQRMHRMHFNPMQMALQDEAHAWCAAALKRLLVDRHQAKHS
jgi:hypothetical protein